MIKLIAVHRVGRGGGYVRPHEPFEVETKEEARALVEDVGCARYPTPAEGGSGPQAVTQSEFPDDFPGREPLIEAEITTFAQLVDVEDLTTIRGIGKKTAKQIQEYIADDADEGEDDGAEGADGSTTEDEGDGSDSTEGDEGVTEPGEPGIDAVEA